MAVAGAMGDAWRRLSWWVERRWYGHADPRPLRWALACLGLVSLALLAYLLGALRQDRLRAEAELTALQGERGRAVAATPAPLPPQSFIDELPAAAPVHALVQHVQHEAKALNVRVAAVSASEPRAQGEHLGYADVALTLQGRYPDIKLLLKQVLERYPGSVVARLSLKRTEAQAADATVVLRLWARSTQVGQGASGAVR